jgi:hypothetical protein
MSDNPTKKQPDSTEDVREMRKRDADRLARMTAQDVASTVVANTVISVSTPSPSSCDTSSSSSSGDCSF